MFEKTEIEFPFPLCLFVCLSVFCLFACFYTSISPQCHQSSLLVSSPQLHMQEFQTYDNRPPRLRQSLRTEKWSNGHFSSTYGTGQVLIKTVKLITSYRPLNACDIDSYLSADGILQSWMNTLQSLSTYIFIVLPSSVVDFFARKRRRVIECA